MNKYVFVTYFDIAYLSRGLALIYSLRKVGIESDIFIVALDDIVYNEILSSNIIGVRVIKYESIIEKYKDEPNFLNSLQNKNKAEIYFTLTPFIINFIFDLQVVDTNLIYLDADIFFYNNIIDELSNMLTYDVILIPHLNQEEDKFKYFKYGIYNVGLILFKVNSQTEKIIDWWKASCINWCYDRLEVDRYADQKYLDFIPILFENVAELNNPGFNVAPWNTKFRRLSYIDNNIVINGNIKLYFYHFHGLKNYFYFWITNFFIYNQSIRTNGYLKLYREYINLLIKINSNLKYLKIDIKRYSKRKIIFNLIFNLITFNILIK